MARRRNPKSPPHSVPGPAPNKPALLRRRRRLFAFAAVVLSLLFITSIEGILRLCGFGGYPPTIVRAGPTPAGTVYYTDNPGPASYFYANKSRPGSINTYTFLMPKPKGTVRIVLAGESAAKGFPHSQAFASSAFLEAMLSDVWPDRKVEVINLGTTAVASFPVLDMLTEALDYEPDLAVVYVGNNEFYGTYGVASLHAAGNSPWAIRMSRLLRGTAIVQGIERLMMPREIGDPNKTLMETMIGQSQIRPDSPLRDAAARNLKFHTLQMIERCKARGVPIIVCSCPGNERDLAPLGTPDLHELTDAQRSQLTKLLTAAAAKLSAAPSESMIALREALKVDPDHPLATYLLGRAQFQLKAFKEASSLFQTAVDLDPMPWRCPGGGNEALRAAAAEGGAIFCDLRQAFRDSSPGGCIGWELMDDHVHPTLAGQALIARSIVHALASMQGPLTVDAAALKTLAPDDAFEKRLGDNIYDRYAVAYTMRELCNVPFIRQTNPGAYDRFNRQMSDFEAQMLPEVLKVARSWQDYHFHGRAQRPISGMVGRAFIRLQRFAEAEPLYDLARRSVALYSSWNLEYNYFLLVCRDALHHKLSDEDRRLAAECIERGKFLLARGRSESGMAERYVGRLYQLRGEWEQAIPFLLASRPKVTGTDLVAVDQALVMSYSATGRTAEAVKLIDNGIENSGEYSSFYQRMQRSLKTSQSGATTSQTSSE